MDTTFSNWLFNSHNTALSTLGMACYMLVPYDCFISQGMVRLVYPATSHYKADQMPEKKISLKKI